MTRIRRINVSQVEGGSADNTDIGQIRPAGETAFYIGDNNKLTLMMFDGVRTHLKSKVLSPGVLFGSNADAGDGSGSDTIKLIPDAALFNSGSDQYIVVDPTGGQPGHIHLRAGGTQDASTANLYLGGEQTFVRVSDISDDVAIRTGLSAAIEDVGVAVVDELVPPGGVWRLFINDSTYPTLGTTVQIGETVTISWGTPVTATIVDIQQDAGNWQIHVDQNITAGFNPYNTVTFNRGGKSWTFDSTGVLTFPDGFLTIQDSQGGVVIQAADEKNISLISSGAGLTGSAIGWYDNFLAPTKLAAVVANNPFYVGEGDVGIVTGDTPGEGNTTNVWNFGADGDLTLPAGGDILDSTGNSVLGSGGNTGNVTFSDQIVMGTGTNDGGGGLYLAPGPNSIADSAVQYLRVRGGDFPTHIHLDTGNNAYYDQYFGADSKYVKLEASGNIVINADDGANGATWTFDTNGDLTVPGGIKSETDNDLSIQTESLPTDPPATIVISGADFTSVNRTYTKDGANSIWYPALYNPATDPYIEFTGGQYGIRVPGFGQALYVNTGTLNVPLAQWNTNPPLGSVAPTGVYTYPNTYSHTWQFGDDGSLTFPDTTVQTTAFTGTGAITFTANEIEGNTFGGTGTIITKTVDNTGNDYSTGSGSLGFLNFGADGNIQNVKAGWTVTFASGATRTVSQDAYQPLGTYWNIGFDSAYVWSAGNVMPVTFSSPDYVAGTDPEVTLTAGAKSWTFDDAGTLTFPGTMAIETTYGGASTLVVDGKAHTVELRSNEYILIGYNNSSGNVYIGNQTSGQVDIVSNKFRVMATVPTSSTGADGDMVGMIAVGGGYLYVCTANWVSPGTANIWTRTALTTGAW